ncbi:MAG: sigma-70 family RNA polymerase sigma factor [Candidatus Marinimicrobia bacterium]|nr:sigma-70 family RNA polymerase sigma factor [Candidatus Neomarinimicrobiota bacterium]
MPTFYLLMRHKQKRDRNLMTDAVLINMYLEGDIGAFNHLVRKWQTPVYNFICRYMGDDADSADISQNIFLKVYKNLHLLQDRARFKSWMFQITANHCKDHLRSRKYEMAVGSENSDEEHTVYVPVDPDQSPHGDFVNSDSSHLLNKALQTLPEEQRLIVVLKEYHGLRFREIAQILQESENTIKSRMYSGLRNIKSTLNKWGISKEDLIYEL